MDRALRPELPAWPVLALLYTMPIGWVLGAATLLPIVWGGVMLALLLVRGDVRVPRVLLAWFGFLVLVAASAVMIDTTGRAIGLGFRFANYTTATIAFLYVHESSRARLGDRRIVAALAFFWAWVVVGGWLGVLHPTGSLVTPMSRVLPSFLLDNELVREWVYPRFAELQQPWSSPESFSRPSAPFAYTNGWGTNFALLVPFALLRAVHLRGPRRLLWIGVICASAVPAVATLNRGMFLALAVGFAWTLVQLALRGRAAPLLVMTVVGLIAGAGVLLSGVADRILLRTTVSSTNVGREMIYREAFERTLDSPLLGWGGPRPSHTLDIAVGTQGHVWNVMFSHGFVALVLFVGTLWTFAWITRRATGAAFAAHITLVMTATAIVYYGFDGPQMTTALIAAAIALRAAADDRSTTTATPVPPATASTHLSSALPEPELARRGG